MRRVLLLLISLLTACSTAKVQGTSGSGATSATTGTGSTTSSTSGSSTGTTGSDPCSGAPFFCDDYADASHSNDYTTRNGTWTRHIGSYEALDGNTWERARSVLAFDIGDFDVTIAGSSEGDSGFGLVYAASASADDGYAVIVHPEQFQGVYLKKLNPGQQDTEIANAPLSAPSPGVAHVLRVQRSAGTITVWLDGEQVLQGNDGAPSAHGQLGLLESTTDQTAGAGARFTLFRIDTWSPTSGSTSTTTSSSSTSSSSGSSGSTGTSSSTSSTGSSGSTSGGDGGWVLVWSDEFDGGDDVPADPSKWQNEVSGSGMGNQELEYYTPGTQNVIQQGGNLVITARENTDSSLTCSYPVNGNTCLYTSGKVNSLGLFSQQYGRFEANIKVPTGQGMWPAFWMMGVDIDSAGWPACGEIDVMENIGKEPDNAYGSLHAPGFNTGLAYSLPVPYSDDFHVFAIEWEPQVIRFYVDTALYETHTPADVGGSGTWEFDREPFYLLLNLAVGGSWPGSPDATTVFPQQMLVDYVRVYARP
ncbi:MAG: glycoside hydrolase family 16 protein [Deltaproteobacteria bacterium]|nr:glycoside hydrolase family 16 protein [Deltaproteobacteria bacterium]